jgi:hypothetical protein
MLSVSGIDHVCPNIQLGSTPCHFAALFQAVRRVPVLLLAEHEILYDDV